MDEIHINRPPAQPVQAQVLPGGFLPRPAVPGGLLQGQMPIAVMQVARNAQEQAAAQGLPPHLMRHQIADAVFNFLRQQHLAQGRMGQF